MDSHHENTTFQTVLPLNASPRFGNSSPSLLNISTNYGFPSSVPKLSPPPRSPSRPTSPRLGSEENILNPSPVKQSPRRHAHRRSAAISHDFDIEGLGVMNPVGVSPKPRPFNASQQLDQEALMTSPSSRNFSFPSGHTKHHSPEKSIDERTTKVAFSPSVEYIPRHTPAVSEASASSNICVSLAPPPPPPPPPLEDDRAVSFVTQPLDQLDDPIDNNNNNNHHSMSLSMASLPTPCLAQDEIRHHHDDDPEPPSPSMPTRRHKKVKSWAGNIIRFRSKKPSSRHATKSSNHHHRRASDTGNQQPQRSSSNNSQEQWVERSFESSSYIETSMLASPPADELHHDGANDVFIDLDAALGLFSDGAPTSSRDHFAPIFRKHRRSESAPEMSLINEDEFDRLSGRYSTSRAGSRGMKRKMSAVLEESEDQLSGKELNPQSDSSTLSSIPSESAVPLTPDVGVGEIIMEESSQQDNDNTFSMVAPLTPRITDGIASRYSSISSYPPTSDGIKSSPVRSATESLSDEGLGLAISDSEFSGASSSTKLSHFRSRSYTSRQHKCRASSKSSFNEMDYSYDFRHHSRSLSKPYEKPYSNKRGNITRPQSHPNPSSSMTYFDEVPVPQDLKFHDDSNRDQNLPSQHKSRRHSRALSFPTPDMSCKFGEPGPELRGGNSQISLVNADSTRTNNMSRSMTSLTPSTNSSSVLNNAALRIKRSVSLRRLSRSTSREQLSDESLSRQHLRRASHDDRSMTSNRSMTSKLWQWIKRKV